MKYTGEVPRHVNTQIMKTSVIVESTNAADKNFDENIETADQNVDPNRISAKLVDVECTQLDKQETLPQVDVFISGLSLILLQWVENTPLSAVKSCEGDFYSRRPPAISIKLYLERMHRFFACSDECFVLALVYISRVVKRAPSISICRLSVHRVVFLAMVLAAKVHDDLSYSNRFYAKVGGLPTQEVNALELQFLKLLDWKLNVRPNEYELYHSFVCQAASRGATYQELCKVEPEPEP